MDTRQCWFAPDSGPIAGNFLACVLPRGQSGGQHQVNAASAMPGGPCSVVPVFLGAHPVGLGKPADELRIDAGGRGQPESVHHMARGQGVDPREARAVEIPGQDRIAVKSHFRRGMKAAKLIRTCRAMRIFSGRTACPHLRHGRSVVVTSRGDGPAAFRARSGTWHRESVMPAFGHAAAARLPVVHQALGGGGGLAHFVVRLVIWHELWRMGRALWRIPTFGPIIVILIVLALVGLVVLRQRGFRWSRR